MTGRRARKWFAGRVEMAKGSSKIGKGTRRGVGRCGLDMVLRRGAKGRIDLVRRTVLGGGLLSL